MGRLLLADGGHDAVVVATASLVAMAVSKSSVAAAAVRRVEGAMSGGHQMLKWRAYICYAPCRSSYYRPSSAHACGRETPWVSSSCRVPTPAGAVFNCCACVLGWLAVYCAAALRHQPALDARSLLVRLFRITREDKQLKYREVIYYLQTNK